jgi:hypothetical protein
VYSSASDEEKASIFQVETASYHFNTALSCGEGLETDSDIVVQLLANPVVSPPLSYIWLE